MNRPHSNQGRPSRARHGLYARRGERGFTMVELMVSLSIFAFLMAAAGLLFGGTLRVLGASRYRSVAANLASQELDGVRATAAGTGFDTIPVGSVSSTQTVDGVVYTIDRDSEWVTEANSQGSCSSQSGTQLAFLRETVTVTWPNMQGVVPVQSQTVLTPPVGTYDPDSGHIAVKVVDRNAKPVDSLPVTITGPSGSDVQTTTSDGCAFFAYLDPGSYTVALNVAGYVDGQGSTNPSQSATVQIGQVTSVNFDYDLAATLSLTLAGASGGTVPSNVPVTLANTALLPAGTKAFAGTGSARIISNLFPYLAGYSAWSGDCADADPEGVKGDGTRYYPTGQRPSPFGMTPGGTTTGSVSMYTITVTVKNTLNVVQPGVTVKSHHAPDNGCATDEYYTLGVTDATGKVTAALPYGGYDFQVVGKTPNPGPGWPATTLDPTVAGPAALTVVVN